MERVSLWPVPAPDVPSSTPNTLVRNQEARRRRVIDAALRLADAGGLDAVQMRDVAAEAGVALGTVYRYFTSKERLLLEAMIEQIGLLAARLESRPARGDTAAERVTDVLARATAALRRSPEATAAMVRALGAARPSESGMVERVTHAMTAIIVTAMRPGAPATLPEADLEVARVLQQVWFSSLIGWVGGVDPPERVDTDLATAAHLLLASEIAVDVA